MSRKRQTPQTLRLRVARPEDAARLAELSRQLGYPSTPEEIRSRLAAIDGDSHHLVLVAQDSDAQVAGWLHAFVYRPLESEACVEIAGLVVDERRRSSGVGRALMQHAEDWARSQGLHAVYLRSNIIRSDAHAFYEKLGYQRIKTQHAFRKKLAPGNAQVINMQSP